MAFKKIEFGTATDEQLKIAARHCGLDEVGPVASKDLIYKDKLTLAEKNIIISELKKQKVMFLTLDHGIISVARRVGGKAA